MDYLFSKWCTYFFLEKHFFCDLWKESRRDWFPAVLSIHSFLWVLKLQIKVLFSVITDRCVWSGSSFNKTGKNVHFDLAFMCIWSESLLDDLTLKWASKNLLPENILMKCIVLKTQAYQIKFPSRSLKAFPGFFYFKPIFQLTKF